MLSAPQVGQWWEAKATSVVAAEQLDRLVQVARPDPRVAHLGAAEGEEVVQVVGRVLGHAEGTVVGEQEVHLGRCFRAGGDLEEDPHAVDRLLLTCVGDVHGRGDHAQRTFRGPDAQPRADLAARAGTDDIAVHVAGTPGHGRAGVHVLGHRMLHETLGGEDRYVSTTVWEHAQNPTEVVGVGVGVDHSGDGFVSAVLAVELDGGGGALGRDEWVDHDDPGVTLDDGHVREVEAANLVDAVGDLEQAVRHAQLGLSPQTGVDRLDPVSLQEVVRHEIEDDPSLRVAEGHRIERGHEASRRVLEVGPVLEIQ